MSDKIDFTLQVLQTTIRVVYEDITRLEVDVLVCPDDVLLTMKGSVSTARHTAAGSALRDDAYKYPRPQPVGEVLITSAGRLKARIDDLAAQITHLMELRKIEQSRLRHLERPWRRKGDNTPAEIITEISEIKLRIEQYNQDIQKAEEQHTMACQDLEGLRQRRQKRLAHED